MIEELIKGGESERVEFKSEKNGSLKLSTIVETVVCLANHKGGYLLIGVEDDGEVTGAKRLKQESPTLLRARIYSKTKPRLWVNVWVERYRGKEILIVEVPKRILTATSDGKYLRRGIEGDGRPSCLPMEPHEMMSLLSYTGQKDFTVEPLELGMEAVDLKSLELLMNFVKKSGEEELLGLSDDEILRILGIIDVSGRLTLAGLLACGKKEIIREIVPFHEVIFNYFKGAQLREQKVYHESLITIFFELMEQYKIYNKGIGEVIKNGIRYEIPLVDFEAYREAVSNALIHRDFAVAGSVAINWYDDGRVVIANPGGFVEGVTVNNILSITPYPRNPLLSEIFRRTGIVEKTGRGVDKIFVGQAKYGKPLPIWDVNSKHVSLTLIGIRWREDIAIKLLGEEFVPEEILILYHLYINNGRAALNDVIHCIQKRKEEVIYFLEKLEKNNILRYSDNNVFLFEQQKTKNIDREEFILNILKTKGYISRSDVTKSLNVSPATALRILKKLVEKGVIARKGKGGGSKYYLVDDKNQN